MSDAGVGRQPDEQQRHRALRHQRMRRLQHDSPEEHLPQVGMEVAGYRLEARLGKGGQGTVFRARREGRLFAVKFIYLPRGAHWAWRELDVMVKLWNAGGLPLEGHGLWPAHEPLFLFLVTPLVRGQPLDDWTREHNPNARQMAELAREGARLLAVVHAAGVVHRDVKGPNLLVCEGGRLVLVDFGVATYEGAPSVTGAYPPGTWSYLSPRVWRAWRGEEQSRACPDDDVWALGVELYHLLTGRRPFQGCEGELVHAILHEEPRAPHDYNPRVPRALGEVCQRMLSKQPGERYADARAVEAALDEVLKGADETWEVPLCEAWSPHHATTDLQKDMWAGGDLLALYERLASYAQRPVRGKPRPPHEMSTLGSAGEEPPGGEPPGEVEPPPAPAVEPAPPPAPLVSEAEVAPVPCDEEVDAAPPTSPVHMEETPPTALSVDTARIPSEEPMTATEPSSAPAGTASRSRRALLVAGALLVLGLGMWLAMRPPRISVTSPVGAPLANPPPEYHPITLEPDDQEVAPPRKRPEGDGGAAPQAAPTPAPVARATPTKDTRVKTPAKAPAPLQSKPKPKKTSSAVGKVGAFAASCTLATGCAGPTTAQVQPSPQAGRSAPPAAECPPGALEAMEKLGLRIESDSYVAFLGHVPGQKYTTVHPGPGATVFLIQGDWGKLPEDTQLSGELLFGAERVYGRFTQAHTPGGDTYPVCMELRGGSAREEDRGMPKKPGSGQDTATVRDTNYIVAVESFE